MANADLWKYCTPAHCREFLLSLHLLGTTGWPPEKELACLYAVSNHVQRHYREVQIPKRDGSLRPLHIPDPLLKRIQTGILRGVLDGMAISPAATAYHKGADIRTNALAHVGKPMLLKLDIQDFFGSIHFTAVARSAFPICYFPPAVQTLLTHLCCYQECLPQGAPTSAAISNLVMRPFDDHMIRWCAHRGIVYTRYCDDMAFSGSFDPDTVRNKVQSFLRALGFSLNPHKTKLLPPHRRQSVTGVVVNEKPQVPRDYRRKLRQEIHYCRRYGISGHLQQTGSRQSAERYTASLLGRIQYVLQINPQDHWFAVAKRDLLQMAHTAAGNSKQCAGENPSPL